MSRLEEQFSEFRAFIDLSAIEPRVAVVLGSGLGDALSGIEVVSRAAMDSLLGTDAAAVAGHAREVMVGTWEGVPLVAFLGRYHLYQGLTMQQVVAPVRALAGTSVKHIVFTNASGGINGNFRPGDLMQITDHINLPGLGGVSPLIPPLDARGVQFVSMRNAYSPRLRSLAMASAERINLELHQGVYAMVAGPAYETAAELRLVRALRADAVGMSTVPEVVMARALDLEVAAISTITNRAVPEEDAVPDHDEVLRTGHQATAKLRQLLAEFLPQVVK